MHNVAPSRRLGGSKAIVRMRKLLYLPPLSALEHRWNGGYRNLGHTGAAATVREPQDVIRTELGRALISPNSTHREITVD